LPALDKKSFDEVDREMELDKTHGALLDFEGMTVGRYTYAPGWHWVDVIAPVVGMDWCQVNHYGYALSGHLRVRHQDGSQTEVGPGEVYHISPGHRGEVAGDDAFVTIEFLPAAADEPRGSAVG